MANKGVQCEVCEGSGLPYTPAPGATRGGTVHCATCFSVIEIDGRKSRIQVSGSDAKEVANVSRKLARAVAIERREQLRMRSPWVAGSFYLAVLAVIFCLVLVAAQMVSAWVLPIVLIAGLLFFMVVGAYQMRQDEKLSEKHFLSLMGDVLKRAPLILKGGGKKTDEAEAATDPSV